jgi:hypothetical protein
MVFSREASMLDYEILILDQDARRTALVEMQEGDDPSTLRCASPMDGRSRSGATLSASTVFRRHCGQHNRQLDWEETDLKSS